MWTPIQRQCWDSTWRTTFVKDCLEIDSPSEKHCCVELYQFNSIQFGFPSGHLPRRSP